MRHLVIISRSNFASPAGAAFSRLLNYARAMRHAGELQVHLVTTLELRPPDPSRAWELEEGILAYPTLPSPAAQPWRRLRARLGVRAAKRRLAQDIAAFAGGLVGETSVLLFPNMHDFALERGLIRACQARGLRVVLEKNELELGLALHPRPFDFRRLFDCLRDWLATPLSLLRALRHDRLAAEADAVIVISTRLEAWTRKLASQVLRVPILMDELPQERPITAGLFRIGFSGHLSERKEGLISFLRALKTGCGSCAGIEVNLLGKDTDADARRVKRAVRRLGLEAVVRFHGQVPLARVPEWLVRQDLLILPRPDTLQNRYGFSTKLASYLAASVPVLATAVGDTALFIRDGVNGYLVPAGDQQALARRLQSLPGQPEERRRVGEAGRRTALEHFHPDRYGPALLDLLFPPRRP